MSADGFEVVVCSCVHWTQVATIYRYENLKLNRTNIMSEMDGQISWQSKKGSGDGQGKFKKLDDGRLSIDFCCRNSPDLKNTTVWQLEANTRIVWDCNGRRVRLTKAETLGFCYSCNFWHPIEFEC